MEKSEIIGRLKTILVDDLFVGDTVDAINETDELGTDLGLDSVGFVELATIVSETFCIEIKDTDIGQGHFTSLQSLSSFIIESCLQLQA